MRTSFPANYECQQPPIQDVTFDLHPRHELTPILVALQHVYQDTQLCAQILQLIQDDVNGTSNPARGRLGLSYWEIAVLAAVRLGCNLDYDALQDLATNHRKLRLVMGVGAEPAADEQPCRYNWKRIQENVILLRPETIQKLNEAIVGAGHALEPSGPEHVRSDTFVVETNIHYPTDSSLLADGLRKVLDCAGQLQTELGTELPLPGWRELPGWYQRIKQARRRVDRACRSKKASAAKQQRKAYRALYSLTERLLAQGRDLHQRVQTYLAAKPAALTARVQSVCKELDEYLTKTAKVKGYSQRRVLHGEKIAVEEKIFSMFETHTQLVNHGKQPHPIQFGHPVLVCEDSLGFIINYRVVKQQEDEAEVGMDEMKVIKQRLRQRRQRKMRTASFDRGFHSPEHHQRLQQIVPTPCIAQRGQAEMVSAAVSGSAAYQEARRMHSGVESAIGALQAGNGLKRCRDRSEVGFARYVGLAILGRNLQVLGKLLLARQDEACLAARSQRKAWVA